MAVKLTLALDEFVEAAASPQVLQQGANVMGDVMRRATATAIGADLRLSNFRGGPVVFKAKGANKRATVKIAGGTYALADKGRRSAGGTIHPRRARALSTPQGPRASARGSKSRGKRITAKNKAHAYEAGSEAILKAIRRAVH